MGEDEVKKIANETFKECLMENLDSSLIFAYTSGIEKENKLLKHRINVANNYLDSRQEGMIDDHFDDLKYILNDCDLESSW